VRARGAAAGGAFEARERLERVARIFHSLDRGYIIRIDAADSPDAVAAAIAERVRERLALP
jgi:thymidylate kinase